MTCLPAGRGTDIVLGGNPKGLAQSILERRLLPLLTSGASFCLGSRIQVLLVAIPLGVSMTDTSAPCPVAVLHCTPEH
jgi:hypothetical protein